MLTVKQIAARLADRRVPLVAAATGLHHNTIYAIRDGKVSDPSHRVIKALSDYLEENS